MARILLVLSLALLAATGSSQTLSFWHYWDGANGQVLQGLIDRYEAENPGVTVDAVFVPGSELVSKLQTAIAGRQTPSLAISDLVAMPLLSSSGALIALDDFMAESGFDLGDYFAGPLQYGLRDGKRYSLPISASNLGLFWNKELFTQAGLDPEAPPRTWDELSDMARTIKEKTGKVGFELFTEGGEGTSWQWQVFLWGAGGEMLTSDLSAPAFNSAAGEAALQFWIDLLEGNAASTIAPWGLFGRGEAAMVMDGSWMTQFFPMQVSFELGSGVFPPQAGHEPATNLGGEQIFIFNVDEDVQRAAWDFIAWFSSPEIQVEWDKQTGFMPVRASVADNSSYQAWVANARPLLAPFVESMAYTHARPPVERYPQLSDILANRILEALYGRATAEQALAQAANEVAPLLK